MTLVYHWSKWENADHKPMFAFLCSKKVDLVYDNVEKTWSSVSADSKIIAQHSDKNVLIAITFHKLQPGY
jgi:hypothetical protein